MNATTLPSSSRWREISDLISAANALPHDTNVDATVATLHAGLHAFAPTRDELSALTFCNAELLYDVLAATYFLRRFTPASPLCPRFHSIVAAAAASHLQSGIEVAAHYAAACETYFRALAYPHGTSPYSAMPVAAFKLPFYLVRPRTLSDRADFRRAIYAERLRDPAAGPLADLLAYELIDTIRAGDATQTAWLLIAWTGNTALERSLLSAGLRLLERDPPDRHIVTLVHANLRARANARKEPQ